MQEQDNIDAIRSLKKLEYSIVDGDLSVVAVPMTKAEQKAAMDSAATAAGYVKYSVDADGKGETWLSAECFDDTEYFHEVHEVLDDPGVRRDHVEERYGV